MIKTQILLKAVIILTSFSYLNLYSLGQSPGTSDSTGTEQGFIWPKGKKMALSLTFDDARKVANRFTSDFSIGRV